MHSTAVQFKRPGSAVNSDVEEEMKLRQPERVVPEPEAASRVEECSVVKPKWCMTKRFTGEIVVEQMEVNSTEIEVMLPVVTVEESALRVKNRD